MATAIWFLVCIFIVLFGFVFVGFTLHHHWKNWADRKRAEHTVEALPPSD